MLIFFGGWLPMILHLYSLLHVIDTKKCASGDRGIISRYSLTQYIVVQFQGNWICGAWLSICNLSCILLALMVSNHVRLRFTHNPQYYHYLEQFWSIHIIRSVNICNLYSIVGALWYVLSVYLWLQYQFQPRLVPALCIQWSRNCTYICSWRAKTQQTVKVGEAENI